MTKEDILIDAQIKIYPYTGFMYTDPAIFKAMDEYAKQQAIVFGFHVLGADPNDPEMGGIDEMTKTYNSFIEQQNKDNGRG